MGNEELAEWFFRTDNKPWRVVEVKRVLGDKYLYWDEYGHHIKCIFEVDHKEATLKFEGGTYVKSLTYRCHSCMSQDQVSYDDQTRRFEEWLKPKELVDGRWLPHQNPFDVEQEPATLAFCMDSESNPLLYRNAVHFIYGKPGTYKSWLALSLLGEGVTKIWDFENGISPTKSRLEALGISKDDANGYTVPSNESEVLQRVNEYRQTKPDIVCIDGFAGLAAVMNVNPESNNDVMRVFNEVFYPLKEAGITVVVLDHLPKDGMSDDYPIGAQAKRAQSDVSLLFKRGKVDGAVDIFISKDRHGLLQERSELGAMPRRVAAMRLAQDENSVRLEISPAYQARLGGEELKSVEAETIQRVFDFVAMNPGCNKGDIEKGVIGKNETKRQALVRLIEHGFIGQEQIGVSFIHKVVKELDMAWTPLGSQV